MLSKLQEGQVTDHHHMVEEISIFQNKMTTNFPNKVLEQVRSKIGVDNGSAGENFGESGVGGNSTVPGDNAWQGPTGSSTTLQDGASFD